MKRLVTALLFVVASSVGVLAQSLPVPSYWLNQRGSEMKLYSINPQGMFNGVYINHASGFGCQGTPFAVNGQAVGNRVTFTVIWNNGIQNCNSKTVWRAPSWAGGSIRSGSFTPLKVSRPARISSCSSLRADPEKVCPGCDPGCNRFSERQSIRFKAIAL